MGNWGEVPPQAAAGDGWFAEAAEAATSEGLRKLLWSRNFRSSKFRHGFALGPRVKSCDAPESWRSKGSCSAGLQAKI